MLTDIDILTEIDAVCFVYYDEPIVSQKLLTCNLTTTFLL